MRVGDLSAERVKVAAWCGDTVALSIVGEAPHPKSRFVMWWDVEGTPRRGEHVPHFTTDLAAWAAGLAAMGDGLDVGVLREKRCPSCLAWEKADNGDSPGGYGVCEQCLTPWEGCEWLALTSAVIAAQTAFDVWATGVMADQRTVGGTRLPNESQEECMSRLVAQDLERREANEIAPVRNAIALAERFLKAGTLADEKAAVAGRATEAGPCFGYLFDGWAEQAPGWVALVIRDAAEIASTMVVRQAISDRLIEWALG